MNTETAKILCKINNDFYRNNSASFSATRTSPWDGWTRCLSVLKDSWARFSGDCSILDIACGNLRFESFLENEFPGVNRTFYAVDCCDGIVPFTPLVHYPSLDIVDALLQGHHLASLIKAPACELSVSFGFMHHLPLMENREELLRCLVEKTRPGGYVLVSFWQFLNNENLAKKAHNTHEQACMDLNLPPLDEGDFLLGWKNTPGAYRYCHHFSNEEIDSLVACVSDKAEQVLRFASDGRTNNLNAYLVLKVR